MRPKLIVNADDCNLTAGVTRAILDCHDQGILTSTTFMINLPVSEHTRREVLRRSRLGVGIHLNVTFGKPVTPAKQIGSLLDSDGVFRKLGPQLSSLPKPEHLALEYWNQIRLFEKTLGRLPTHLDTHHQVHDDPFFFGVISKIARSLNLPLRRSQLLHRPSALEGLKTTEFIFGNLTVEGYWRPDPLDTILAHLPNGVSEIMCHPGIHDKDLEAVSSFRCGRVEEYKLFSSPVILRQVQLLGIELIHFGHVL